MVPWDTNLRGMVAGPQALAGLVLLGSVLSCSLGDNLAGQALSEPSADPLLGEQARCGVVPTQSKPLVVEWPSTDRVALEASIPDGLLVVRYEGCEMEVLGQCRVKGQGYAYRGVTRKYDTVSITDADELYAEMPVGAAKLEGRLEKAEALKVSMTTVGMFQAQTLAVNPEQLQGSCTGATHFVHRVQVGAYEFFSEQSAGVAGGAGAAGGPAVGAESTTRRGMLAQDGDSLACELATHEDIRPPDGCGAPLRLEVVALASGGQRTCAAGSTWNGSRCVRTEVATADASTSSRVPPGQTERVRVEAGKAHPAHPVTAFEIDKYETTSAEYARCVLAGACKSRTTQYDAVNKEGGHDHSVCPLGRAGRDGDPMVCVDLADAAAYCKWRGARLPTRWEWELAAKTSQGEVEGIVGGVLEWSSTWASEKRYARSVGQLYHVGVRPMQPTQVDARARTGRLGIRCANSVR